MQKNWYIIYTKPETERKLSRALSKKKIENFFPLQLKTISKVGKTRTEMKPLFPGYVFASLSSAQMASITSMSNVINFVYWKQHPVLVANNDILLIKEFTTNYTDITIQKMDVDENSAGKLFEGYERSITANTLAIKNTFAKVNLASLGISIIANVRQESVLQPEIMTMGKVFHLQ